MKSCSTTPPLLIQAHISRSIFLSIHSFSSAVPISSILKVVTAYGLIVFTMIVITGCYTALGHCRRHSVVCLSFLGLAHKSQPGLIALHAISAECSDSPAPSSTTSTTSPTRRPHPKALRIVTIYRVTLTAAISPEELSLDDRVSTIANRLDSKLQHALAPWGAYAPTTKASTNFRF